MSELKVLLIESPSIVRQICLKDFDRDVKKLIGQDTDVLSVKMSRGLYLTTERNKNVAGSVQNGMMFSLPSIVFKRAADNNTISLTAMDCSDLLQQIGKSGIGRWIEFSKEEI